MENWSAFTAYRKRNFIFFQMFSVFANLLLLVMPIYSLQIYGRVLTSQSTDTLLYIVLIVLFFVGVQILMDYTRQQMLNNLSIVYDATFDKFFVNKSLIQKNDDQQQLVKNHQLTKQYLASPFHRNLADLPWTLVFTVVLFILHPAIGLYALISLLVVVAISSASLLLTHQNTQKTKALSKNQNVVLGQILGKKELLNVHLISDRIADKWKNRNDRLTEQEAVTRKLSNSGQSILKVFRMFVQVGIYALCAWLVIKGQITSGSLLASSILLGRILAPVDQGASHFFAWKETKMAYQFIDTYLKTTKPEETMPLKIDGVDLLVDKVSFTGHNNKVVINKLGFNLKRGSCLQVVGMPGAGKSTLLKLCAGCLNPTDGGVRINGVTLDKISRDSLVNNLSYLSQRPELFDASIAENICGFDDVNANSDHIIWASQAINCMPFISKLKHGYSTPVGRNGSHFSESEKQRIALAGVLYKKPKLMILDEPTSNLDPVTKAALINTLTQLKQDGSTIVFSSHDNDMRLLADYIIEIKDGALVKAYENKVSEGDANTVRHINTPNVKL